MSRHTIDTVRETITTLRDQETVYKTDVDSLKHAFSRAFEGDWNEVNRTKFLSIPHEDRTEVDHSLYNEAPYEVRHWYGKKFSKFLEEMPSTGYKDAAVSHRNRWRPLFQALEDLKVRQVKGRKPVEKKVVGTRKQLRAICPCCFKQHAVRGELLVAHGYTLDHGFQNGSCMGEGKKHFGTTDGVQFTQELIRNVKHTADRIRMRAEGARKGEIKPVDRKTMKTIEKPTPQQVRILIANLESEARHNEFHAEQMQKMVDRWKPAEPVEVEVEITE